MYWEGLRVWAWLGVWVELNILGGGGWVGMGGAGWLGVARASEALPLGSGVVGSACLA